MGYFRVFSLTLQALYIIFISLLKDTKKTKIQCPCLESDVLLKYLLQQSSIHIFVASVIIILYHYILFLDDYKEGGMQVLHELHSEVQAIKVSNNIAGDGGSINVCLGDVFSLC